MQEVAGSVPRSLSPFRECWTSIGGAVSRLASGGGESAACARKEQPGRAYCGGRVASSLMIAGMRRSVGYLAAAVVLGVVISLLKGTGGGARLQAGNISAPWLAIAFVAGALYKRPSRAAGAGVAATL